MFASFFCERRHNSLGRRGGGRRFDFEVFSYFKCELDVSNWTYRKKSVLGGGILLFARAEMPLVVYQGAVLAGLVSILGFLVALYLGRISQKLYF